MTKDDTKLKDEDSKPAESSLTSADDQSDEQLTSDVQEKPVLRANIVLTSRQKSLGILQVFLHFFLFSFIYLSKF